MIKERLRGGTRAKVAQGKFTGGSAPYGYTILNGSLLVVPGEAETVRNVLPMRAEGETLQAIADYLNARGEPTKRGGKWSPIHVRDMLQREEFYKGLYKYSDVASQGQHTPDSMTRVTSAEKDNIVKTQLPFRRRGF